MTTEYNTLTKVQLRLCHQAEEQHRTHAQGKASQNTNHWSVRSEQPKLLNISDKYHFFGYLKGRSLVVQTIMEKDQFDIYKALKSKYEAIGQDVDTHLQGLLHSKPITYWDYIKTDALLSLQQQD